MGSTTKKSKRNQTTGTGDRSTQESQPRNGAQGGKSKAGSFPVPEMDSKNFARRVSRDLTE